MMIRCKYCQHEWDYTGKNVVSKCSKCMKHINIQKSMQLYEQGHGAGTGESATPEMAQGLVPKELEKSQEIVVQEVKVTVPPELREELKEVKPGEGKVGAAARAVEIPYKTVEIICQVPFSFWANFEKDDAFKLTKTEVDSLVPLVKMYLDAHMGGWFSQYSSEIAIAIVLGMIMVVRLNLKAAKRKKREETAESLPSGSEKPSWVTEGGK